MKLNLGCGDHKVNGFIGVDKIKTPQTDIVHDLTAFPYPFKDSTVHEVLLSHVLEHLPDTIKVMEEIWRICKNGARIKIFVPYYNSPGAYHDPTHQKFFTEHSFDYLTENGSTALSVYNYYSFARFRILSVKGEQRRIFFILPERIRWFMAHHLSTIHSLGIVLEVVKK